MARGRFRYEVMLKLWPLGKVASRLGDTFAITFAALSAWLSAGSAADRPAARAVVPGRAE